MHIEQLEMTMSLPTINMRDTGIWVLDYYVVNKMTLASTLIKNLLFQDNCHEKHLEIKGYVRGYSGPPMRSKNNNCSAQISSY